MDDFLSIVAFILKSRESGRMSIAAVSANSEPGRHTEGSFEYLPRLSDEWLTDLFYSENIGFTGEPKGVVPDQ